MVCVCRLRYTPKPKLAVCILGDQVHCDQAAANNLPFKTQDDLKKLNKDKRMVKKLGQREFSFCQHVFSAFIGCVGSRKVLHGVLLFDRPG